MRFAKTTLTTRTGFAVLTILLLIGPVLGQVTKLTDESSFSQSAVRIDFGRTQYSAALEGAQVGKLYSGWGLTFVGSGSNAIRFQPGIRRGYWFFGPILIPPELVNSVVNQSPSINSGSSANHPLIVNFDRPVRRVAFRLVGSPGITASLSAFDEFGFALGAIQHPTPISTITLRTFVGLETSVPQGMSKIVIDYGDSATAFEELDEVLFDYTSATSFVTYLAQVADGPQPGGDCLRTVIVATNVADVPAQARLTLVGSDGNPLVLEIDGIAGSQFDFALFPRSSKTFTSSGRALPLRAGYARIESNTPVEGTVLFQVMDAAGALLTEAGVSSTPGGVSSVGAVHRTMVDDVDSGIAFVNTSTSSTRVELRLFDEAKNNFGGSSVDLGPNAHQAKFLIELFPSLPPDFRGSVTVVSSQSVAVVILRLKNGRPFSGLPLGSTKIPASISP